MPVLVAPERSKASEEPKKPEESVNLYEVLDDRFALEGCCRFLFSAFFFLIIFQLSMSASYYADIAGEKSNFKDKLIVPNDHFERKQFNAWGIQLVRDLVDNHKYFGDKMELMRVHASLQPILCNYKKQHPKGTGNTPSDGNSAPKSSLAKSYENICPVLSSGVGKNENMMSLLQSKYKLYSEFDTGFWGRLVLSVPIYSAEIHESTCKDARVIP